MAEAVLTFFLEKLSTFIAEEANLLLGVDEEIRELQNELEWMRLFMKNADAKRRADTEVKLMVKQIREITFMAEDVIDEFILKIHQRGGQRSISYDCRFTRFIKSCITCTLQSPLLHELLNQIKVIKTMSNKISTNKSKYSIEACESSHSTSDVSTLRKLKRASIAEEWDVVGIEDSMKQVKSLLMESVGDEDRRRRIVVSITGMGGLGKTTLAKKLYNNIDIKRHFDYFAWISVSQEYKIQNLLQGIIKCVRPHNQENLGILDEEETRKKLRDYLQGNHKYLIVLDDIWDFEVWDGLNDVFPDEMNGSRILLTTRNTNVAEYADSSSNNIHLLRFLNEEERWELFLNKIFVHTLGGRRDSAQAKSMCPPALEEVGKEMVEKCGGLPLAIVVLGGLLSCKDKTYIEWSKVNANLNWQLTHGAGSKSCSGILALSYYDLPYYLKPCFLYVGLYREDHEIVASKLSQCWIAEGFVQKRGKETMEDVAEDYLEELIHRSMIMVGKWTCDGRVRSFRVHDLLRDLAIAEAKEDQFLQIYGRIDEFSAKSNNNVRRLIIHGFNLEGKRYLSDQFRYTRSLMCFGVSLLREDIEFTSRCFKLLKILQLDQCRIDDRFLPKAIGELIHLKYLSVPKYMIIPDSIIKLVNLQTLNLRLCNADCTPSQIWGLRQLRHLVLGHFNPVLLERCRLRSIGMNTNCDLEIDNLSNLQTLQIWTYGGINGGSLGKLRMLKKLKIHNSVPLHNKRDILDSIGKLTGLRSLELQVRDNDVEGFPEIQFSRHNYLTKLNLWGCLSAYKASLFPPNLIKLSLRFSKIETEDMVQDLARLHNLKFLLLHYDAYIGKILVFPQEGFVRLQYMELRKLDEVEELIMEEGAFVSLTHLVIDQCRRINMLPEGLRQITTLEELKLLEMPKKFIARLSENDGEDWEKIKHTPSVIIQ